MTRFEKFLCAIGCHDWYIVGAWYHPYVKHRSLRTRKGWLENGICLRCGKDHPSMIAYEKHVAEVADRKKRYEEMTKGTDKPLDKQ